MNTRQAAEIIARSFFGTYHEVAEEMRIKTGVDPATRWLEVPEDERKLLAATFQKMLEGCVIRAAASRYPEQPATLAALPPVDRRQSVADSPRPAPVSHRGWN